MELQRCRVEALLLGTQQVSYATVHAWLSLNPGRLGGGILAVSIPSPPLPPRQSDDRNVLYRLFLLYHAVGWWVVPCTIMAMTTHATADTWRRVLDKRSARAFF